MFLHDYADLPDRFFARTEPSAVSAPRLIRINEKLARELGFDPDYLRSPEGVALLSGNHVPAEARPIALAYAGHQFGQFVPQLGDGRAVLLGEVRDGLGRLRDVQLKGSGRTVFSRGGDGRAAVGPVLREFIVSEAMAAMGIPTTRTLAAVTTGDPVFRETRLPGAVLARVAASHLRIGTFQYFAIRGDVEALRALTDYAIGRHYPERAGSGTPALSLLDAVITAQAELVARWMMVGFIHGVMNTDNMTISGETIDYGPCAFIDDYDPATVFSSIDHYGRYAYANQPHIAIWNLARFAETLLPLIDEDHEKAVARAEEALAPFSGRFEAAFRAGIRRKLGLAADHDGDIALARDLLDTMARNSADFTLIFRALAGEAEGPGTARRLFAEPLEFDVWAERWRARLSQEETDPQMRRRLMLSVNPAYIPRNHRVEAAIRAATEDEDFGPFEELLTVLERPFEEQLGMDKYAEPPAPEERVTQTFCGT